MIKLIIKEFPSYSLIYFTGMLVFSTDRPFKGMGNIMDLLHLMFPKCSRKIQTETT